MKKVLMALVTVFTAMAIYAESVTTTANDVTTTAMEITNTATAQETPVEEQNTKMSKAEAKELADKILKKTDESMYPPIFKGTMKMTTYRNGREPLVYDYEIYSKNNTTALLKIVAPPREKGKKILMTQDNLWMYMPEVSRPIRLTRKQSFMGSTFSNEDLTSSKMYDDYDPDIIDQKGNLVLLRLKGRRDDVAYATIDFWVDKDKMIPTEATYYGLAGKAIKKMFFSDLVEFNGKLRPSHMKMEDLLEKGSYTEVIIETLEKQDSLPDYLFDQSQMGR